MRDAVYRLYRNLSVRKKCIGRLAVVLYASHDGAWVGRSPVRGVDVQHVRNRPIVFCHCELLFESSEG